MNIMLCLLSKNNNLISIIRYETIILHINESSGAVIMHR